MKTLVFGVALAAVVGAGILVHSTAGSPAVAMRRLPAMTVNGTEVSARALRARAADPQSFEQFKAQLVEHEIADQLIRQEASRRRLTLSEAEERELDRRMPPAALLASQAGKLGMDAAELAALRRDGLRTTVLLRKLLEQDFPGELAPSEAALREAFDQAPLVFAPPPTATVRGFLVPLPEAPDADQIAAATAKAARIVAAARAAGSGDAFSRLAAGEGVVPDGLPDGKIDTLALADPFEPPPRVPALFGPALSAEVTRALFPGPTGYGERVVGPFRGPQGMFGLYVEQRHGPGAAPSFERVRDRVRDRWIGRAQMALAPRLIERLRATATIELNQGVTAS